MPDGRGIEDAREVVDKAARRWNRDLEEDGEKDHLGFEVTCASFRGKAT